jgi:IS30 family transposase
MQSYTHFTLDERESLRTLYERGLKLREIAKILDRSPSTISRELRRNCNKTTGIYNPWGAESLYLKRRKNCRPKRRFCSDEDLQIFTQQHLAIFWSPEIIAAIWNRKNPDQPVSHTTIYNALKSGLIPGCSKETHLRRRGRRKYTRGATATIHPDRVITERSEEINQRTRLGDWEGDTMSGGVGKGCLLTCIERKSRYLVARVSLDRRASSLRYAFQSALGKQKVHSLTLDRGSEFAEFRKIESDLQTEIYFCDPHSPWQRGSIENINGALRFFFPKGFDFRLITQEDVDRVVNLLNNRPRKCLGFLSPHQVLHLN